MSRGPRVSIRSKATCAAPLGEVLTPCRGLRPHHVGSHRNLGDLVSGRRRRVLCVYGGPHWEGEEPKPMMHGHEKSDLVIVAMKPANKAKEAHCGGVCGGERSGVGGAKGGDQGEYAPAQHVLDPEPGSRDKRAGAVYGHFRRHTPEVGAVCGKAARTVLC